jgi:hypothetical protein
MELHIEDAAGLGTCWKPDVKMLFTVIMTTWWLEGKRWSFQNRSTLSKPGANDSSYS